MPGPGLGGGGDDGRRPLMAIEAAGLAAVFFFPNGLRNDHSDSNWTESNSGPNAE